MSDPGVPEEGEPGQSKAGQVRARKPLAVCQQQAIICVAGRAGQHPSADSSLTAGRGRSSHITLLVLSFLLSSPSTGRGPPTHPADQPIPPVRVHSHVPAPLPRRPDRMFLSFLFLLFLFLADWGEGDQGALLGSAMPVWDKIRI